MAAVNEGERKSAAEREDYLGEQWREAGALAAFEPAIDQGPGMYLGALGAFLLAGAGLYALLWYLAGPRLAQLASALPVVLLAAGAAAFLYLALEYAGLAATVYSGRNFLLPLARSTRFIVKLAPAAGRLGRLFGSTADRMTHSMVQVSNAVTRARRRRGRKAGPVLVLLPRCLQRPGCPQPLEEDIDSCRRCGECPVAGLLDLRNEYDDVVMKVLTGGSVVPGVVRSLAPRAVIGVACERELLAGIMAVDDTPVVGVANQRPEGPCRATTLTVEELEEAIDDFASKRRGGE
ncbi:MAG: DUF116 domain-containing protein [Candidatus Coatesbacteria bacterium]|nr:MAG: DUF116 domain-containing protein [Candidatus Coatesbacteria bacterium]